MNTHIETSEIFVFPNLQCHPESRSNGERDKLRRGAILNKILWYDFAHHDKIEIFQKFHIFIYLIAVLLCAAAAGAQEMTPRPVAFDLPKFYAEAMNFSYQPPDSTRLDLFLQVPYQMLSFTKDDEVFRASYDVTINIFDSADAPIIEKLWTEKVNTKSFSESVSKHTGNISQRTFFLRPGEYNLQLQIADNETKKVAQVKRKVIVRKFSPNSLSISDIMVVGSMSKQADVTEIVPNVSSYVGEMTEGFSIFFEAYDYTPVDSAMFVLDVRNLRGDIVQSDTLRRSLQREKNSCFMKITSQKVPAGEYEMEVRVFPQGGKEGWKLTDSVISVKHIFTVRWKGLPTPITDLDLAIDQLQYISNRETIDSMKNADPASKKEKFLAFWKKRDPTPNTETNELMEEYFQRIDYANKNFSHYVPGWKSDRGMVYIIFGAPSNIERRPFDMDSKPYEIWTYFEMNREFVFVDQSGFGDYRLQTPIWDVWRRGVR
jgi:GWxTD domain-containing protein